MRQLTRAVVHSDRQQIMDIKVALNAFQNYARGKFTQLEQVLLDLARIVDEEQQEQEKMILWNWELKRKLQDSFSQLLSPARSVKPPATEDDASPEATESKSFRSPTVSTTPSIAYISKEDESLKEVLCQMDASDIAKFTSVPL